MSYFSKLWSNAGFSQFRAMAAKWAGMGSLQSAMGAFGSARDELATLGGYATQRTGSVPIWGKRAAMTRAGKSMALGRGYMRQWATGRDIGGMGMWGQRAVGAGRVGAAGLGIAGAADFLNPWGFGWND